MTMENNSEKVNTSPTSATSSTTRCADCGCELPTVGSDEFRQWFPRLVVVCDACTEKRDAIRQRDELVQALTRRFDVAVARGIVASETRTARWTASEPSCEAENATAWQYGRAWAYPDSPNLYIYGDAGTGKTFLCRCILRAAFLRGCDIAEVSGRRLMKIGARFDEGRGLFDAWCHADVLLLDDIDKTHASRDGIDCLWELMDSRCSAGRRTLVTANSSLKALSARLAESGEATTAGAALDRLRPLETLKFAGRSLR